MKTQLIDKHPPSPSDVAPGASSLVSMDEASARMVVLVMALELDRSHRLLSPRQSDEAGSVIWRGLQGGGRSLSDQDWMKSFALPRARRLIEEIVAASPRATGLLDPYVARVIVGAAVLLAAFLIGFLGDRLPNEDRINLVAAPLGVFLIWNWCSVVVEFLRLGRPRKARPGRIARAGLSLASRLLAWRYDTPTWFSKAVRGYHERWIDVAAPLMRARVAFVRHLGAVAMSLGVLFSVTWSAWHMDFKVGWASTLCKASCVTAVQNFFFAPTLPFADFIGATPFTKQEVEQMERWQHPDRGEGERWLRLTAALLVVTVMLPRLLLMAVEAWHVSRLRQALSLSLDSPYFKRLRMPPDGGATGQPADEDRRMLPRSLGQKLLGWFRRVFGRCAGPR